MPFTKYGSKKGLVSYNQRRRKSRESSGKSSELETKTTTTTTAESDAVAVTAARNNVFTSWVCIPPSEYICYSEGTVHRRIVFKHDNSWEGYVDQIPLVTDDILAIYPRTFIELTAIRDRLLNSVKCSGPNEATECKSLVSKGTRIMVRCEICVKKRRSYRESARYTPKASDRTSASSRVPFRHLTHDELEERAAALANEVKRKTSTIQHNQQRINKFSEQSVSVTSDIEELVNETINTTQPKFDNDIKELFWQQQIKQSKKSSKGMRWHPMLIRWALTIRSMSSNAYDYIRESGMVSLPHNNTLNHYVTYRESNCGLIADNILHLDSKLAKQRDVILMHDEVKVKERLVYERWSGRLIGYVELGDINTALKALDSDETPKPASHALCFMARSITSKVCIPVAQYATCSLTADMLYQCFWEVVEELEFTDIRVRASVSDGAGTNRRFIKLHENDYHEDKISYRAYNHYGGRPLYFVSDVPHLVKTTRNCVENSHGNNNTRNLMLHGKPVIWAHITQLYYEKTHTSFDRLWKIKKEHVKLNPFSRMRVNLAAQVLSQSVANALRMKHEDQLSSTIELIEKINDVFDMLNVRYAKEGQRSNNKNRRPYESTTDDRFKWLHDDFIGWLDRWEEECTAIPNLTKDDIQRAQLSQPTITGWKITCLSFISLCKELLSEGHQYVLSEKLLCQDEVEQYFALQRRACGTNNAPTLSQYLNSERTMSVVREVQIPSKRGNCRGNVFGSKVEIDATPLKKKKAYKTALKASLLKQ